MVMAFKHYCTTPANLSNGNEEASDQCCQINYYISPIANIASQISISEYYGCFLRKIVVIFLDFYVYLRKQLLELLSDRIQRRLDLKEKNSIGKFFALESAVGCCP